MNRSFCMKGPFHSATDADVCRCAAFGIIIEQQRESVAADAVPIKTDCSDRRSGISDGDMAELGFFHAAPQKNQRIPVWIIRAAAVQGNGTTRIYIQAV